jgi:hypothetical protein
VRDVALLTIHLQPVGRDMCQTRPRLTRATLHGGRAIFCSSFGSISPSGPLVTCAGGRTRRTSRAAVGGAQSVAAADRAFRVLWGHPARHLLLRQPRPAAPPRRGGSAGLGRLALWMRSQLSRHGSLSGVCVLTRHPRPSSRPPPSSATSSPRPCPPSRASSA